MFGCGCPAATFRCCSTIVWRRCRLSRPCPAILWAGISIRLSLFLTTVGCLAASTSVAPATLFNRRPDDVRLPSCSTIPAALWLLSVGDDRPWSPSRRRRPCPAGLQSRGRLFWLSSVTWPLFSRHPVVVRLLSGRFRQSPSPSLFGVIRSGRLHSDAIQPLGPFLGRFPTGALSPLVLSPSPYHRLGRGLVVSFRLFSVVSLESILLACVSLLIKH